MTPVSRIVFEGIPESWRRTDRPNGTTYQVEPGVEIEVPYLRPLPDNLRYWADAQARTLPTGASSVRVEDRIERKSRVDWPMFLQQSVAMAGDRVVETRIHVVFCMIDHGAIAVVRAPRAEQLEAARPEIMGVLETARPEWGDTPGASLLALHAV